MKWIILIVLAVVVISGLPATTTTNVTTTGSTTETPTGGTEPSGLGVTPNRADMATVDHRNDPNCVTRVVEPNDDWTKIAAGKDFLTVLGLNHHTGWLDPDDLVCVAPAQKADEDQNGAPHPPVTDSLPDDRCPEGATSPWPACTV